MIIPVVFSLNDNYIKYLLTAILSILKNAPKKRTFEFNILYTELSKKNIELIKSLVVFNKNTIFNFYDVSNLINGVDKYQSPYTNYISKETYYRFYIPQILEKHNKCIYLDVDVVVLDDLYKLYNLNIENKSIGAIKDMMFNYYLSPRCKSTGDGFFGTDCESYLKTKLRKKQNDYFNAGVLIFNLEKLRANGFSKKAIDMLNNEAPFILGDQDVLNSLYEEDVYYIDPSWNVLKEIHWIKNLYPEYDSKLEMAHSKPKIYHYIGENKPDVYKEYFDYAYDINLWWKYYRKTSLYNKERDELVYKLVKNKNKKKFFQYIYLEIFKKIFLQIYKNNGNLYICLNDKKYIFNI